MTPDTDRTGRIRKLLERGLDPIEIEVIDESHLHAGHAGARDGRGHFRVTVVSPRFVGRGRIERHRMVFEALGTMMATDIHALSVSALDPSENRQNELTKA